jgi:hypothetical protein
MAFPLTDNLPDVLACKAVPLGDFVATPTQHEVQNYYMALKFTFRVLDEDGNLTGEADLVLADCGLQLIQPQSV